MVLPCDDTKTFLLFLAKGFNCGIQRSTLSFTSFKLSPPGGGVFQGKIHDR